MEQSIITFKGNNDKLFYRHPIQEVNAKTALIVPETHTAILVKDGQMLQTLNSGKYVLSKFLDLKTESDSALEILFMSKTAKLKLLWGTANKFLIYDAVSQESYHTGMSGDFEVQIGDPRKCYLYLVGTSNDLTSEELQERLVSNVVSVLEDVAISYVSENKVPLAKLSVCKQEISRLVLKKLSQKLLNEYGIAVFSFNIANIIIDEKDYEKIVKQKEKPKQEGIKVCLNCGEPLAENDKFCSECGFKVEKVCPNCATTNPGDAKFCSSCGYKL